MSIFTQEANTTGTIFTKDSEEQEVSAHPASEKNLAVQASVLSDGPTDQTFEEIQALPPTESRAKAQREVSSAKMKDQQGSRQAILDAMGNPEIPEETRVKLAESFNEITQQEKNSLELLGQDFLLRESSDNAESEEIRLSTAEILKEATEEIQDQQRLANQVYLSEGITPEAVLDFAQLMIPFDENIFTTSVISKIQAGDATSAVEALTLLGNSKADLRDYYRSLDDTGRAKFRDSLAAVVQDSRGLLFVNDNELAQADLFNSITKGEYYGDFEQGLDNVINILDFIGLGGMVKPFVKTGKLSKIKKMGARSGVQPASPARVAERTNPKEARTMKKMAIADETGEVAQATHAATREDVIVDVDAPQPRQEDESVQDIVHVSRQEIDEHLQDTLLEYSDAEVVSAQKEAEAKFSKVGPLLRHESSPAPIRNDDGSTTFSNTYTMEDSGWISPQDALDSVKNEFRFYDVADESFKLMQKQGNNWVPVDVTEIEAKLALREALVKSKKKLPEELHKKNLQQEFAVRVDFTRDFDPMDVKHEALSYTRNLLDRVPFLSAAKKGASSLTRMLFDPASIFDPRVFLSANYVVDKTAAVDASLIRQADSFVTPFKALDKDKQEVVYQLLKEQNVAGRRFTKRELLSKGISNEEAKIFDSWADTWDTIYELENKDLATSLKRGGWGITTNKVTDTQLISKPIKNRGSAPNAAEVLDGSTGAVRTLRKDEVDALYESGGTINTLRRPENVNDTTVKYTLSRNTSEDYFRELKGTDRVLNYREGYFSVRYEDPYFIVDKATGKAVKTASGVKAAKQTVAELTKKSDGVEYTYRENRDLNRTELDDFTWDVAQESGRLSQRVRGERLGSDLNDLQGTVQDPAQSLLVSARSISRRASMRGWLDKMKLRFMDEFEELLPEEMGQKYFPRTPQDLKTEAVGPASSKKAANARTMLEYINSMEHGYRNTLDEGFKAMLNGIAEAAGVKSARAEKALRAVANEAGNPTAWLRGRAFDLYLATNPLRQFIVQGHQATLLTANFPAYVAKQGLTKDLMAVHLAMFFPKTLNSKGVEKLIGMSVEDAHKLAAEYKATGFDAGIDRHNLVEAGLDNLVETKNFSTIKQAHKAIVTPLRKVGFDAGERINIMSAWLAYRNRALEAGEDITNAKVKAKIMADARNYTLNMNAAGEMPYNKNALALVFQFMQVPHKMLTTLITNRALNPKEKARLAAYNLVMLPLPTALVYNLVGDEGLPEDPDLRDLALNGLQGAMLNKMAQLTFGDDTRIDFTSLSALDPYGLYELMGNLLTTDIVEIFSNSPSMSLFVGHNPKLGAVMQDLGKLTTAPSGENLQASVMSFISLSSGGANLSQAGKELFFSDLHKRVSRSGFVTDEDVTMLESVAKAFGFGTQEEALERISKTDLYKARSARIEDVKEVARLQHNSLARRGVTVSSEEYAERMLEAAHFGTFFLTPMNEGEKEAYLGEIRKNINKGDDNLFSMILRSHQMIPTEAENALKANGYTDTLNAIRAMRDIEEYDGEL